MNDSEVDPITRKNPDEKYYFFVEKFKFQNHKNSGKKLFFFSFFFLRRIQSHQR